MTPLERAAQMQRNLQLSDERMIQMRIVVAASIHHRPRVHGNFIPWESPMPGMIDAMLEEGS